MNDKKWHLTLLVVARCCVNRQIDFSLPDNKPVGDTDDGLHWLNNYLFGTKHQIRFDCKISYSFKQCMPVPVPGSTMGSTAYVSNASDLHPVFQVLVIVICPA